MGAPKAIKCRACFVTLRDSWTSVHLVPIFLCHQTLGNNVLGRYGEIMVCSLCCWGDHVLLQSAVHCSTFVVIPQLAVNSDSKLPALSSVPFLEGYIT